MMRGSPRNGTSTVPSYLSSEDEFELIGKTPAHSASVPPSSSSSESLPTTAEEVREEEAEDPPAAKTEESVPDAARAQAPRAEADGAADAATAAGDAIDTPAPASPAAARRDRESEDGSEEESEEEDFDEHNPPRFLTVARVTSSSATLRWEADPDVAAQPSVDAKAAAAAAGVVEQPASKRPAFVLQHATDSIWAAWGDPTVCFANEVRLAELAASSDYVVRVARCLSSAAGAPANSDEDMLVRCGSCLFSVCTGIPFRLRDVRLAPSFVPPLPSPRRQRVERLGALHNAQRRRKRRRGG